MADAESLRVTRHKPTKALKDATHRATESDYRKLGEAVVRAILLKQRDIVFRVPYFAELSPDMPKGICIHKTPEHNYYRAKAAKMADWLHAQGWLPADAHNIVLSCRDLVYKEAKIQKMLAGNLDVRYNERSGVVEQDNNKEDKNANSCDDEEGC